MFEIKNFDGKNKSIIEVVSSDSALGLLRKSGNENLKVFLPLELCIGRLDSIKNHARSELREYVKYVHDINDDFFYNAFNFEYEFKKLKGLKSVDKIRIWSSHLDCNDYCLLLFMCNYFDDKNISVVFSEEYNQYTTTLGNLNTNEINELLKREHILKKSEVDQYKKEWKQIVLENTELRFMINGLVKSVSIDYFDDAILNRLEQLGEVNIYLLVADLMGNPIFSFVHYSDYIYLYLIHRLIDNNLILKVKRDDKLFVAVK